MMKKPKLLALESLRGFAAVAVVLHHFSYGSLLSENAFIRHSYLMVDFFFVLSGFVIALNYADRLSSAADVANFQLRRFWRLYPLHVFTLMLFLGIECLKYVFEQRTGIVANSPAFTDSGADAFLANLFLLQGIVLKTLSFNIPSWSISVEFWTYLIFAALICLFRPRLRTYLVLICGTAAILFLLGGGQLETDPRFAIIRCIYSFFLGASAALLRPNFPQTAATPVAATALVVAILAIESIGGSRGEILLPLLFAVAVAAIANLRKDAVLRRALELPGFVWLGTISYSIYMTHSFIGWIVTQGLRFGFRFPTHIAPDGATMLTLGQGLGTLVTLVALAGVLAFSQVTFRFIETPFRSGWPLWRWSRREIEAGRGVKD